ncbi:hypothetical protein [Alloalcanivorax mobilis]|uniref:hypothetical protein n=1 Tax=Alloalcanivorax mobilis TaxID=2019569 RepID=UPI000B5B11FC|nr:hypothetical protein [Alloalcanivorax mobilis]ASK34989.1 hypothetical protein CEK62_11640 [Alcanivorax sp. N3-2A]|tara:strand:- start:90 stop:296 length:207 start_codon:yes stop_codon:yes gene_type:complete
MPDVASLIWGFLFGCVGMGLFIYGKKQAVLMPLVCGAALMIYPWFVTKAIWVVVVGVLLTALPYFIRL